MKKFTIFFLATLLLAPFALDAALRNNSQKNSCSPCSSANNSSITRTEMEKTKLSAEEERDQQMFMGFLGIVSSFIKLFIDPHNIPEAKQNAMNIVSGVVQIAQVITRQPLTPEMHDKLMDHIIEYCSEEIELVFE